jgi:hypothetical protein
MSTAELYKYLGSRKPGNVPKIKKPAAPAAKKETK